MSSNLSKKPDSNKGVWQFQEAKAKLSEVLNRTDESGKQVIVRNKKNFVILNEASYNDYLGANRSILGVFLRCPHPEIELDLTRSKETLRDLDL